MNGSTTRSSHIRKSLSTPTWLNRNILAGAIALCAVVRPTLAVVGCLIPLQSLTTRAELVVVAKIEAISRVQMEPCKLDERGQQSATQTTIPLNIQPRCGEIETLRISIHDRLRGNARDEEWVRIPRGMWSLVQMSCDDRPTVSAMVGLHAVFFLESTDGQLWTLDGPNSIYATRRIDKNLVRRVKDLLQSRRR